MAVRSSMSDLIAKVRLMIGDSVGANQHFQDIEIQMTLDQSSSDVRYENLIIAPSIVNNTNTNHQADTIFADFYSRFGWWEANVVLQANKNGAAWVVVTPVAMELLLDQAHFQFELDVFGSGSAPGQLPPVMATGRTFDVYRASADLLEMWAATLSCSYDISINGQNLHRSQMMQSKLTIAHMYRRQAKPKIAKMIRSDVNPTLSTRNMRLLDDSDLVKGA